MCKFVLLQSLYLSLLIELISLPATFNQLCSLLPLVTLINTTTKVMTQFSNGVTLIIMIVFVVVAALLRVCGNVWTLSVALVFC